MTAVALSSVRNGSDPWQYVNRADVRLYVIGVDDKRISGPHSSGETITIPAGCGLWDGSGDPGYYIMFVSADRSWTGCVWQQEDNLWVAQRDER